MLLARHTVVLAGTWGRNTRCSSCLLGSPVRVTATVGMYRLGLAVAKTGTWLSCKASLHVAQCDQCLLQDM